MLPAAHKWKGKCGTLSPGAPPAALIDVAQERYTLIAPFNVSPPLKDGWRADAVCRSRGDASHKASGEARPLKCICRGLKCCCR